jgi:hypothetical protein
MYSKSLKTGKKAGGKTKAGTDTWFVGLSKCGSMIAIKHTNGCKSGTYCTQDLFWNETLLINGKKETGAIHGND